MASLLALFLVDLVYLVLVSGEVFGGRAQECGVCSGGGGVVV